MTESPRPAGSHWQAASGPSPPLPGAVTVTLTGSLPARPSDGDWLNSEIKPTMICESDRLLGAVQ